MEKTFQEYRLPKLPVKESSLEEIRDSLLREAARTGFSSPAARQLRQLANLIQEELDKAA